MVKIEYKEGEKINGFTFLKETECRISGNVKHRRGVFICRNCGDEFTAYISHIKKSTRKGCENCYRYTHGLTNHRVFYLWNNIKERCFNPKKQYYYLYGGRGIKVCDEWMNDLMAFYEHIKELPNAWAKGYSLDRINNNGNYEPGNVRWADGHTQSVNSRKNPHNTSGYTGVHFAQNTWRSTITVNKERIYLGGFKIKRDAVKARNDYIIKNNLIEYKIQKIV